MCAPPPPQLVPGVRPRVKLCLFRVTAEHHELRGAALQPVGPVVRQHAADRTVRPQRMAGTQLWSLRTDLGSAGLQVSPRDPVLVLGAMTKNLYTGIFQNDHGM